MIRLSIILNGSYGVQGRKSRSDEWNKMYRKYMNFEIYIAKVEGLNDYIYILRYKGLFLIENLIIKNNLKNSL